MIEINLLPWREELSKQKKKEFGIRSAISVALGVTIMFFWYSANNAKIEHQNSRNAAIDAEIKSLDARIGELKEIDAKKTELMKKLEVIYELKLSRPMSVHMFDELSNTVPSGVYLNKFSQSDNKIEMEGMAESNSRVSAYMDAIDRSLWINKSDLKMVEMKSETKDSPSNAFSLTAMVVNKIEKDKKDKEAGVKK